MKLVQSLVEVTHTNFAEITRVAAGWREARAERGRGVWSMLNANTKINKSNRQKMHESSRGGEERGGGGGGDVLFVEVNAVVVLTTGVTATGGVLAPSADAALTHRCLTTLVAGVLKS